MTPLVIKLGGVLLDDHNAMEHLFHTLSQCCFRYRRPIVIVHGGGCLVDDLMKKLALPVVRRNGLRVTPADQIGIIVGALAGSANKALLAVAKKFKLKTIGLCLADGDMVAVEPLSDELGHVGDAKSGRHELLDQLISAGYIPVISSIGITDDGLLMNVNADHAATEIAVTLKADLILLSDVSGIMDDKGQCITELSSAKASKLIEKGIITDGMIVKVNAAFDATQRLMRPVTIASWRNVDKLNSLFNCDAENNKIVGTRIMV